MQDTKSNGAATGERQRQVRSALRRLGASLLVMLPGVPIVAAIVLSLGSVSAARGGSVFVPAKLKPTTPVKSGLPGGSGALVAYVTRPTEMRASPTGHRIARVATKTGFGSVTALWVVTHRPGWLGVVSPQAGNGRIGWIPASAANLTRTAFELRVSLSAHQVTVLENGKVVQRYPAAIGRPTAPTPTGRFAVTDLLNTGDPAGPYGCCILALSASAPHAIADWSGGNRVAIHSTPDSASIGTSVSHGCVRVSLGGGRWLLGHIPLGTPTLISS